jgi:hypothetical protein
MNSLTFYQWVTLALGALGFLGTWIIGAFTIGRAVEQMKAGFKHEIGIERDKIFARIESIEEKFLTDQRTQDHNFGEVGAAMRQYIADVEKKVRENEIWGRDNFVQKGEFQKATDRIEEALKEFASEIKTDLRTLTAKIDAKA